MNRLTHQQPFGSSNFQPFSRSSNVFAAPSLDSDANGFEDGERFSRMTFSLMSQQLLSPMWDVIDIPKDAISIEPELGDNDAYSITTNKDENVESPVSMELNLPAHFISLSSPISKEEYLQYAENNDLNGVLTV